MLFLLIFFVHFQPNFTSHSLPHLSPLCLSLLCLCPCLSRSRTRQQEHNSIVPLDTEQLVYWATDIPKQSCCGSSSPGSCAGTSSAATECSHLSKFWTSWTQSMSRSVSTAQRLLVIDRFLATTTARSPQPTASMRRTASHWGRGGLEINENILSTLQALVESTCHLPADNRLGTFQIDRKSVV